MLHGLPYRAVANLFVPGTFCIPISFSCAQYRYNLRRGEHRLPEQGEHRVPELGENGVPELTLLRYSILSRVSIGYLSRVNTG